MDDLLIDSNHFAIDLLKEKENVFMDRFFLLKDISFSCVVMSPLARLRDDRTNNDAGHSTWVIRK